MATDRHEVTVSLGVDQSTVARDMARFSGTVKSTVDSAAHHIRSSFGEAFHHLFAPLSVGGAIAGIHSLAENVKDIKRISESTGVSTGLVQDMMNLAKASGLAGESIEKALDFFVKGLPSGTDPETALLDFADKMAKVEDPTERARMAIDAFGKSGVKLVPILSEGSEGVKKLAAEFGKLSDEQIELIEHADRQIEKSGSKFKVWSASVLEGLDKIVTAAKHFNPLKRGLISEMAALFGEGDPDEFKHKKAEGGGEGLPTVDEEDAKRIEAGLKLWRDTIAEERELNKERERELIRHKNALAAILGDTGKKRASVDPLMFAGDVSRIEQLQANIRAAQGAGRGDLAFSYGLDLAHAQQSLRDKFNAQIPGKTQRDTLAEKLEQLLGPTINKDGSINVQVQDNE